MSIETAFALKVLVVEVAELFWECLILPIRCQSLTCLTIGLSAWMFLLDQLQRFLFLFGWFWDIYLYCKRKLYLAHLKAELDMMAREKRETPAQSPPQDPKQPTIPQFFKESDPIEKDALKEWDHL